MTTNPGRAAPPLATLVERTSYQVAWLSAGASLCVAGVLVYTGSRWLQRLDARG